MQALTCCFVQFFKVPLREPYLMHRQVDGAAAAVHNHVFVPW